MKRWSRNISFAVFTIFLCSVAFAQDVAPKSPSFGELIMRMLPMFVMVFFVFYFLVSRPQMQKIKAQQELLSALKKGDTVVTSGGIVAKVAAIEDPHVLLDLGNNTRLRVERDHVSKKIVAEKDKEKVAA